MQKTLQKNTAWLLMTLLVVSSLAACNLGGPGEVNPTPDPLAGLVESEVTVPAGDLAVVVGVIDGDTIDVNLGGSTYRVRYIGINTPEVNEPCSAEAAEANVALVNGQTVTLIRDLSETDQYDRLLRYVYIGELFVNAELVRQGWAEAVEYPPDLANAGLLEDLEDAARLQNLGCWPSGVFGEQE
ncbi:MAG: thermonuclease family protein [Anaerolineae bacterium]|nr:thermonuclease family protein [Anaerolineae bacterium]